MTRRLTRNAAKCLKCGEIVESKHRHDFRSCSCGGVTVDGGLAYSKRMWHGGNASDWFVDLNEYESVDPT